MNGPTDAISGSVDRICSNEKLMPGEIPDKQHHYKCFLCEEGFA